MSLETRQAELAEQTKQAIAAAQSSSPWDNEPCIKRFEDIAGMRLADLLVHPSKWAIISTK